MSSTFKLKTAALFYGARRIKLYHSEIQDTTIRQYARKTVSKAKCSSCLKNSGKVRSAYVRKLVDQPLAANSVLIMLEVRRFACNIPNCKKLIFSERFDGFALFQAYN